MVSLRPITDANRKAVEALRVSPAQEQFVSSVADSLLEAAQEPDAAPSSGPSTPARRRSGS